MIKKALRATFLLGISISLVGCCDTHSGYGRYTMSEGCETVVIEGNSYQVSRSGTDVIIAGRTLQRGINRDATPWLYLHNISTQEVDITFDKGSKDIYPLYTGITASIFDVYAHPWEMTRSTNAAFSDNHWLVSHRWTTNGIYYDLQKRTGDVTEWQLVQPDILVPDDGTEIIIPQINSSVKILSFDGAQKVARVQFKDLSSAPIPVLFVHGHSRSAQQAWQSPGIGGYGTSFAAAMASNPQLPIDPFYLELPLHGFNYPDNLDRSIEEDAEDILAVIEGGPDSHGDQQVGILNMPEYGSTDRVAIIAYSQGTLSSRFYIKNLMGSRYQNPITVSEFVTLAAPNHGTGGTPCEIYIQPDKARRQLCGGMTEAESFSTANCGNCNGQGGSAFFFNDGTDTTFITSLNGHPFSANCSAFDHPDEAPHSRPSTPDGILYINLFSEDDTFVGGSANPLDCDGRRLAWNHAPDAENRAITGVAPEAHEKLPHYWPTICMALRSVVDHQIPTDQSSACANLAHP